MTRIEFQKWLDQFDEDTVIEIVYHTDGHGYYDQGGNATTEVFKPDYDYIEWCKNGHFEYTDFTNNQFVRPHEPHFGKKILIIGGIRQ